jgi:hypothetical protein
MSYALSTTSSNGFNAQSACRSGPSVAWSDDLPAPLKNLVVTPVYFQVHEDYEIRAGRTTGCDLTYQLCYCASHFVLTELRTDDDDVFYETPVYTESRTCWRLIDGRWLVCRVTMDRLKPGGKNTQFEITQTMPR